jgi:hypothetical protein
MMKSLDQLLSKRGCTIRSFQVHRALDGDGSVVTVTNLKRAVMDCQVRQFVLTRLAAGDGFEVLLLKQMVKPFMSTLVWKRYSEQFLAASLT